MGEIISEISKIKISRSMCYPTRYQEIAHCFENLCDEDIYIRVSFLGGHEDAKKNEYSIMTLQFDPKSKPTEWYHFASNAKPNDILISINVNAIPCVVTHESKVNQHNLSSILSETLRNFGRDIWKNHWKSSIRLVADECCLECRSQQWKGLQELPTKTTVYTLDEDHDTSNQN